MTSCLISAIDARDCDSRRNYAMMLGATAVYVVLCFLGPLGWPQGLILLALLTLVLWDAYRAARAHRRAVAGADAEEIEDDLLPNESITTHYL